MTDIVERLRKQVVIVFKATDETEYEEVPDKTCQEAADEIERLREENEQLREKVEGFADTVMWHSDLLIGEAKKALGVK